jgi:hypothetical protein
MQIKRVGAQWRVFPTIEQSGESAESHEAERRLIWIPAVPSTGTSCVAGLLQHLGVNMGNVRNEENRNRGYEMFEDLDVGRFAYIPNSDLDRLMSQRVRFKDYCNYRIAESPPGRIGVKALPTAWIYCREPKLLPVDVLDVRRDLEVSVTRDQERMSQRPMRDEEAQPLPVLEHLKRAGGLASMWLARDMLLSIHPPKLTLQFDEVREGPMTAIEAICESFHLEPSDKQIDEALRFVQPKGKM